MSGTGLSKTRREEHKGTVPGKEERYIVRGGIRMCGEGIFGGVVA